MTDILKAKDLFKKAGLGFPVLPKKLVPYLKERYEWTYSTRPIEGSPYDLNHYLNEDDKTKIDDYAVLSNSGHGINSYAIQYYLVCGPLRMFLFLGWGGVYMDKKKAAIQIKECFVLADKITKAVSKKLRSDSRLMVVVSDLYGSYWSPHDKRGRVIPSSYLKPEQTPQQVLGEVLEWLDSVPTIPSGGKMVADYKTDLKHRYLMYQKSQFPNGQRFFERPDVQNKRPPVFIKSEAWRNIIFDPAASQQEINKLLALVSGKERHKWFSSMNSSQALAQSILGNLAINNSLHYLSDIKDDEGQDLFGKAQISSANFKMEHKISYLGEREPHFTSLDGYVSGDYQIAIECKYTEADVGTCSRLRLKPKNSNYESEHCDGTYSIQRKRKERCSLTEIRVLYWSHVPTLFKWKDNNDLNPCPLNKNYQLVRNILAAGVKPDGTVSINNGHVLLIYDDRNPAFQNGGKGMIAYIETQKALKEPTMLRKCSWQRIVQHIRENDILSWLTESLALKYGL